MTEQFYVHVDGNLAVALLLGHHFESERRAGHRMLAQEVGAHGDGQVCPAGLIWFIRENHPNNVSSLAFRYACTLLHEEHGVERLYVESCSRTGKVAAIPASDELSEQDREFLLEHGVTLAEAKGRFGAALSALHQQLDACTALGVEILDKPPTENRWESPDVLH